MRGWILAFMTVGVAGCGGLSLVQGDAQLPDICTDDPAVAVPGAPIQVAGSLDVAESYPLDKQISQFGGDGGAGLTDLEVTSVTLKIASGVADFHFLDSAQLTVATGDPAQPEMTLFRYTKDPSAAPSDTLVLQAAQALNLMPLLQNNSLQGKVSLHGTLPGNDWSLASRPCFSAKAHFKY